jgi:thiol:disulfide interchange protein DsbC
VPDERHRATDPIRYNADAMKTLSAVLRVACALFLALPLVAAADEASVRKLAEIKFKGAKIDSVVKTPYGDLYEVFMDNRIFYTDEQMTFMFVGELIDTKTNARVTELRYRKLTALNVKDLPPTTMAVKKVNGNGKRTLYVFTDPMCPFCKGLEKELVNVPDVSIYYFLYPIENKFPGSTTLANSVWCSPDRGKAWSEWMLKGVTPTASASSCKTPVAEVEKFGGRLGITVTPTLIFADGARIEGAIRAPDIDRYLAQTPVK